MPQTTSYPTAAATLFEFPARFAASAVCSWIPPPITGPRTAYAHASRIRQYVQNRAKTERHTSRELCGNSHFAWDNMQKQAVFAHRPTLLKPHHVAVAVKWRHCNDFLTSTMGQHACITFDMHVVPNSVGQHAKNSDYFMLSHTITHRQLWPTVNFRYHTLPADSPSRLSKRALRPREEPRLPHRRRRAQPATRWPATAP